MRKVLVFIFIILSSCNQLGFKNFFKPSKGSLANDVINKVATQLKKEKDLYPFGTGSQMMHQIKMLALSFRYYKEINIEKGRELLMEASAVFLDAVNQNEAIREYLGNFPFKPKNIELRIFLKMPDGHEWELGKLCVLTMVNGVLEYEIHDPDTKRLTTIFKETYKEAAEKLQQKLSLEVFQ